MSSKKVFIIYKPGCSYSERALSILVAYKEHYPNDINIYLLPTQNSSSVSAFCAACGLCNGGNTFPQIWVDTYEQDVKKDSKQYDLKDCTGYVGGCNDLIKLMNDLGFNWANIPGKVIIKWDLLTDYYYAKKVDLFENFILLDSIFYYWG
jgi:hypothetical protein